MGEYRLFFDLLQIAIGNRKSLSRTPSEGEWGELYTIATRQALTGVCFVGVQRLKSVGTVDIPEMLYLKWLGMAAKIQQRNKLVNAACGELVRQYTHDGLTCCILKGQGNLENYPEELREARNPGDIDVWVKTPSIPLKGGRLGSSGSNSSNDSSGIPIAVCDLDGKGAHGVYPEGTRRKYYTGYRGVIEYVKMLHRIKDAETTQRCQTPLCKKREPEVRYHHIDAPAVNGIEVEVHFRPLFLDSPLRNHRLQNWFKLNEQFEVHDAKIGDCIIPTPTASFNAVYQLCHIYRHLFDEGVGLRQLLDYYFVLKAFHVEQETLSGSPLKGERNDRTQSIGQWAEGMEISIKSNAELMHTISRLGMSKFASAVMWVLEEVLDPSQPSLKGQEPINWQERWPWMLCEPDEEEGRFLMNEIMLAGNFGKYDDRLEHKSSTMGHAWEKLMRNMRFLSHYPEEVVFEPFFRVYHYIWRLFRFWRFE